MGRRTFLEGFLLLRLQVGGSGIERSFFFGHCSEKYEIPTAQITSALYRNEVVVAPAGQVEGPETISVTSAVGQSPFKLLEQPRQRCPGLWLCCGGSIPQSNFIFQGSAVTTRSMHFRFHE